MRRSLLILLMALVCSGMAAEAQAAISIICGVSSAERAVRTGTGQERARQALGLQYAAAGLRHL